ncbi:MAG: hypothetical protein ACP6IP_07140 [Candidatus Njordarchaeia archaeon]
MSILTLTTSFTASSYSHSIKALNQTNNVALTTDGGEWNPELELQQNNEIYPNNLTRVEWNIHRETYLDKWSWRDITWEFGPQMKLKVFFTNGTAIKPRMTIPINEPIIMNVTMPKDLLEANRTLSRVNVRMWGWTLGNGYAEIMIEYDVKSATFAVWCFFQNNTNGATDESIAMFYVNESASTFINGTDLYKLSIVGYFTNDAKKGIYTITFWAMDNQWQSYEPQFQGFNDFKVAVGDSYLNLMRLIEGDFFTMHVMGENASHIYTVSSGQKFKILINVTTSDIDNVTVRVEIPPEYERTTIIYDWHKELVEKKGGWIYNTTTHQYVWDPNATIKIYKDVYGPHEERITDYRYLPVNTTYYDWENDTFYNTTTSAMASLLLVYNKSENNFKVFIQAEYSKDVNTTDGPMPITVRELYDPATLGPEWQIYTLLENESYVDLSNGTFKVLFTGYFTDMVKGAVSFIPSVMKNGSFLVQLGEELKPGIDDRVRLAVNQPYVEVYAPEAKFGTLYVNKGEAFPIIVKYTGDKNFVNDVDGFRAYFYGYKSKWTENETWDSYVEITVTVDIARNLTQIDTFNVTYKSVYEYGTYWGYNESTDEYGWIEGWHWETYFYNQSSGTWVKGYPAWHTKETRVSNYVQVINYTLTSEDVFKVIKANLTFTNYTGDLAYSFNLYLVNITYGEDESMPYGEYEVFDWREGMVYSFNYGGDRIYVELTRRDIAQGDTTPQYNLIVKRPYIVINGTEYNIKYKIYEDPMNPDYVDYQYVFWETDPYTGESKPYYILAQNDTKIYIKEDKYIRIFQANITFAERDETVSVNVTTGYPSFIGFDFENRPLYVWFLTNGSYIVISDNDMYNVVKTNITIKAEAMNFFVYNYNTSSFMKLKSDVTKYDPKTGKQYLELENGTKLYVQFYEDPETHNTYYYYEMGGSKYFISYPDWYISATYNGIEIFAGYCESPSFYYTEINGKKYELPYPSANVQDFWQLQETVDRGGALKEREYVKLNGTLYIIQTDINGSYYIKIGNTTYPIVKIPDALIGIVNGTVNYIDGYYHWRVPIGNYTNGVFTALDYINVTDYYYPYGSTEFGYFTLENGTTIPSYPVQIVFIYKWNVSGSIYYSYDDYINDGPSGDNETEYVGYITLLNGSRLYIGYDDKFKMVAVNTSWAINGTFTFNGETYNLTALMETTSIHTEYYQYIVTITGAKYLVPDNGGFDNPDKLWSYIFNVTYKGTNYTVIGHWEPKMEYFTIWGRPRGLIYKPFYIEPTSRIHIVIVGTPDIGMWGMRSWAINPENGALDLDGNLATTDDQYYVKRVYIGNYTWSSKFEGMDVHLFWDPNVTSNGNELDLNAWMGIGTNSWVYTWNETFYWYYANNMSLVSHETMQKINETVIDQSTGEPKPGYWDIAWMTKNMSWEDILKKARKEGWDWIENNNQTWTWLWFGFEEGYMSSISVNETFYRLTHVDMRYEFAGLFIYNDSNNNGVMDISGSYGNVEAESSEATHYYIFESVKNVTFISPGETFGNYNDTGVIELSGDQEVVFGVVYQDINGTTMPFNGRSYWWWFGGELVGEDFNTFDDRPVKTSIDLLTFRLHFKGNLTAINDSYYSSIKIDQYVGRWTPNIAGGFKVLENRSLSLNYYVYVETDTQWSLSTENGTITNDQIAEASSFSIGSEGGKFAEIIMGDTYLWEGNTSVPQNISSFTVPLGTFESVYVDYGSDTSAAGWSFRSDMYFLSVGFTKWDGYGVYEDPEVITKVGGKNTSAAPKADTNPPAIQLAGLKQAPNYDESPKITATVKDESDVKKVTLYYSYSGYVYTIDMMKTEGDTYEANIPALPYGTQVSYWIIAEDVYGNTAQSDTYTYTVADYDPPQIASVQPNAEYIKAQAAVEITITVEVVEPQDASGVHGVYITYTIDGESHSDQLTNIGGDTYQITIIVPENKQTLTYTITAEDNAGNQASTQTFTINISEYIPPGGGGQTGGGGALGAPELAIIITIASMSIIVVAYYVRKSR